MANNHVFQVVQDANGGSAKDMEYATYPLKVKGREACAAFVTSFNQLVEERQLTLS